MSEPITINVTYTAEDLQQAHKFALRMVWKPWVNYVMYGFMIFSMLLLFSFAAPLFDFMDLLIFLPLLPILIGWIFAKRLMRRSAVNAAQRMESKVFTFDEEGIQVQGESSQISYRWSHWKSVQDNGTLLLLMTREESPILFIPKREVPEADTLLRLRTLIECKVGAINAGEAVKTLPPPPPAKSV